MSPEDRKLLEDAGFTIDCESPFEISMNEDGGEGVGAEEIGSAKGEAASLILTLLQISKQKEEETAERIMTRFRTQFRNCSQDLYRKVVTGFGMANPSQRLECLRSIEAIIEDHFKP